MTESLICPNDEFMCAEGDPWAEVCIESHRRCDGYNDCEGATMSYYYDDEMNCEGKLITAKFSERYQTISEVFLSTNIKCSVNVDDSWTEWQFEENKYCNSGEKLETLKESSWEKARAACARNSECTMVVRLKCEKTNTFYLCKGVSKVSPPKWGSCASYHLDRYTGDDRWTTYRGH